MVVPTVADRRAARAVPSGAAAAVGDPWAVERGHRAGGRGAGRTGAVGKGRRRIQPALIC